MFLKDEKIIVDSVCLSWNTATEGFCTVAIFIWNKPWVKKKKKRVGVAGRKSPWGT